MRVKNLRKAMLPGLMVGDLSQAEREKRWKLLFDLEVAQQAFHFPPDYLLHQPSAERIIETVERYEEVLGNANPTVHGPMKLHIKVGKAIAVQAKRERGAADLLMGEVRQSLQELLGLSTP